MTQLVVLAVLVELLVDPAKCALEGPDGNSRQPAHLGVDRHVREVGEDDRLVVVAQRLRRRLEAGAVHPANKRAGRLDDGAHQLGEQLVDLGQRRRDYHLRRD
eukprot:scaffold13908_cov106-Isochrysis_galbana.AAC.4